LASAVPASAVTGEKETNTDGSAVATPAVTSPSISVMDGPTATARWEQDRRFLRGEINSHVRRQNRADTEIHRRVAFSLACFSFLFVGLPFVFLAERRSRLVPFFYTNVFVVLPFFLLVMLGVLLGERGYYPAVALAIPNVLLLGAGAYLWSRVLKR
jgi:lipopolysaccharide export LptBFGC system permease protein LptF